METNRSRSMGGILEHAASRSESPRQVLSNGQVPAVYEHGGGFMASMIAVVPGVQLAVWVFTNAFLRRRHALEAVFFASALKLRILDGLLGLPATDWMREFDLLLTKG